MKILKPNTLYIYTDGSSLPKPRAGGIGIRYVILDEDSNEMIFDKECFGYKGASNNQMELNACVEALRMSQEIAFGQYYNHIEVRSDSRYVVDNVYCAKYIWPKQKWFNRFGKPILNVELWKDLIKEIKNISKQINFVWVKGHAKDEHNKAVDKSAKWSAKSVLNEPLAVVTVRRKITKDKTKIGSVRNTGQRISIRIISSEYLREQQLAKYRYEVISKGSQYFGKVDLAYSTHIMRDAHSYVVTLNRSTENSRILKVIREIEKAERVT